MSPHFCDKEEKIVQAVRTGSWDDQLRRHASHCALCAETMQVVTALGDEAELASAEPALPDAAVLWRKAQREIQRRNVARATWPIAIAWRLSYLFAGLFILWGLFRWARPVDLAIHSMRSELAMSVHSLPTGLSPAALQSAFLISAVGLACVLLGSLYMTRADA